MPWPLVEAAFASPARLAVVPLQDLLGLGGEARMNVPGQQEGNWRWRYASADLTGAAARAWRPALAASQRLS
jgi:4-alpha-glucanotransferase